MAEGSNRFATKAPTGQLSEYIGNCALTRLARARVRRVHRRPLRPPWPRKPRPDLRRILRDLALRNRARRRPPARRILWHLAHLHASTTGLRHSTMAITRAI